VGMFIYFYTELENSYISEEYDFCVILHLTTALE